MPLPLPPPPVLPSQDGELLQRLKAASARPTGRQHYAEARIAEMAKIAWMTASEFRELLLLVAKSNGSYDEVLNVSSGYRKAQIARGGDEGRLVHEAAAIRLSTAKERELREYNREYIPVEQVFRAISFLARQERNAEWAKEVRGKRVVSRSIARNVLEKMLETRPIFPNRHPHIFDVTADNCHAAEGKGSGSQKNRAVQRLDEDGDPINTVSQEYIASFDIAVDVRECPLSDAAVRQIAARGPYTQSFERVMVPLHPSKSEEFMMELLQDAGRRAQRRRPKTRGQRRLSPRQCCVRCLAETRLSTSGTRPT